MIYSLFTNFDVIFTDCDEATTMSSPPKLHQLGLISGSGKTVRVIERVAARWKEVATRLYFEPHVIDRIGEDTCNHSSRTISACRRMFNVWITGTCESRQPVSWDTLIRALEEARFSTVANDLKIILGTDIQ